ncbi:MAG: GNAT family N-acetyltransferase [Candidatus Thermoplasmatota archaeon]|nr:GNAT family N-acetyltransferase [Candidatus Thermoplasmatota archaeon]
MPSARISIRRGTKRDLNKIISIEEKCFDKDRFRPTHMRYLLWRPDSVVFVAEISGAPVGFIIASCRKSAKCARIHTIDVLPEFRRKGIGNSLLAEVERIAIERGVEKITLEVRADNFGAKKLYRNAGYEIDCMVFGYYQDGMDAIRMEKKLAAQK